jgi:hypothetical protein
LYEELDEGESSTQTMTIYNDGGSDLEWSSAVDSYNLFSQAADYRIEPRVWPIMESEEESPFEQQANTVDMPYDVLSPYSANGNRDIIEETIGNWNTFTGAASNSGRGNVFYVEETTTLVEQRFYLSISNSTSLNFSVYVSDDSTGSYALLSTTNIADQWGGRGWYTSGAIDVLLEAGKYYYITCSWLGTVGYGHGIGNTDVYFGATSYPTEDWSMPYEPQDYLYPGYDSLISANRYYQTIVTSTGETNSDWLSTSHCNIFR